MPASDRKHRKGCLIVDLRFLAWLMAGVCILGIVLVIWQGWSSYREGRQYTAPGKRYDLGGFYLHLYCTGSGTPTIILESGLGGPGEMWGRVQPELSKNHQVCSYDRAGLGWSDTSPNPRTVLNIVGELHTLLSKADVQGPYILVGHSFGGYIVRVYAHQFPGEVVGMVLVGAGHEDFSRRMPTGCEAITQSNISFGKMARILTYFGITRIAGGTGLLAPLTGDMFKDVPPQLQMELSALTFYQPQYWQTYVAEMSALTESEAEVRAAGSLGDLPLIVISGNPDVSRVPPGCQASSVVTLSRELQDELANLSTRSNHITCDTCGHYIPLTDPQLVIEWTNTLGAGLAVPPK